MEMIQNQQLRAKSLGSKVKHELIGENFDKKELLLKYIENEKLINNIIDYKNGQVLTKLLKDDGYDPQNWRFNF